MILLPNYYSTLTSSKSYLVLFYPCSTDKRLWLFLIITTLLSTACQPSTPPNPPTDQSTDSLQNTIDNTPTTIPTLQLSGAPIMLVVTTQQAVLRAAPSIEAPELLRLNKGDSLLFTNQVSASNTQMRLEGIDYEEPWLRVVLPKQQMAWVYGGCVSFEAAQHPELTQKVLEQRLTALFGRNLAQQVQMYQKEQQQLQSEASFRVLYTRGQLLKDSLEQAIQYYLQHNSAENQRPNFFWLNQVLAGFVVHYETQAQQYYLARDWRIWQDWALQTSSANDDAWMLALLQSYPSDSIEYQTYGWQLQLDSLTCSLAGSGQHTAVLDALEMAWDSSSYFLPEIKAHKQAVVDDLVIAKYYWKNLEAIQAEIDTILARKYTLLERSDYIGLKSQKKLLSAAIENNIVLNLFEGM